MTYNYRAAGEVGSGKVRGEAIPSPPSSPSPCPGPDLHLSPSLPLAPALALALTPSLPLAPALAPALTWKTRTRKVRWKVASVYDVVGSRKRVKPQQPPSKKKMTGWMMT